MRYHKLSHYATALALVQQIDHHLTHGTRHYRSRAGTLLHTLDQVVNAILENDLNAREPF